MHIKDTDKLWTTPYRKYRKPMIFRSPGDEKMPHLVAVYARGISPDGRLIDELKIPEKTHNAWIVRSLVLELKNEIPEIPSVQLEIGQGYLMKARIAMERAIKSSISFEDIGLESLPNPIATPALKEKFSFPSLHAFARIDDPEIAALNGPIGSQILDLARLYIDLRRSSLGRCVKGIGPN